MKIYKEDKIWLSMVFAVCIVTIFLSIRSGLNQRQINTYNAAFTAGKAEGKIEAEKTAANEKKGRIYRVLEIKTPKNLSKKGEISWITVIGANVEKRDFVTQDVECSHVYDKTDERFLKQFGSAKFVVIGEDGELIPLSSYIRPERTGG